MRLFVAAFPPESVRSDLRRRLADAPVRLTPVDRWHITLRFFGEVADDRRPDVERALDGVPRAGKISLRLAGGGRFSTGRSAAVWAGVEGDLDALTSLHDAMAAEPEPFRPHLTVAYGDSEDVLRALDGYVSPEWTVEEFVLVRSHHATGGGYQSLRAWPLTD